MVHEVAVALSDIRIGEILVHGQRLGLDPLAVLIVEAFLRDLTDIDLRVEVGGEGLVVVAGVAVDDVEVLNLVELVLGSVGSIDAAHTRVEAAAEDRCQAGLTEAVPVGPLPAVFEVSLVLRLIVGRVEVAHATSEAGVHDRQVLIGEGQIDYQVGLAAVDEGA